MSRLTKFTSPLGDNWLIGRYLIPELMYLGEDMHGVLLDLACGESPFRAFFPNVSRYLRIDMTPNEGDMVVGDMCNLPLVDQSIDVVLLFQAITDVPDSVVVLTEVGRVLKPGGRLLIFESMSYPQHDLPYDYYRLMPEGLRSLAVSAGLEMSYCKCLGGLFTRCAVLWNTFIMAGLKRYRIFQPLAALGVVIGNLTFFFLDKVAHHPLLASDYLAVLTKITANVELSDSGVKRA